MHEGMSLAVGLQEWACICQALLAGTLILAVRKGWFTDNQFRHQFINPR